MPRFDWGIIAALVACLILASVGLWTSQKSSNNPDKHRYPAYEQKTEGPAQTTAIAVPHKLSDIEFREPCKNLRGLNESELCAQWRATEAAENSAFWAQWGFLITIVGSVGLFLTILQGRAGLGRATDANKIAREIGQAQARAYLSIESARLVVTDTMPFWEVEIKNSGQSPAAVATLKIVPEMSYMDFSVLPNGQPLTALDFTLSEAQCGSLAPGEIRNDTKIMFRPSGKSAMPVTPLGAIIMDPKSDCFVSATFFLKWIDVFGVECDASGSFLAQKFNPTTDSISGIIGIGETRVRTSVYDTVAWFDRWNLANKKG